MVKVRLPFICLVNACLFSLSFFSSPALESTEISEDKILMSFFPEPFVAKTLEKFNVPQAQRDTIQKELSEMDEQIIMAVEEKASKMNPNPLLDPSLRKEAIKIFRDTLLEKFSKVMESHGVTNKEEIASMLDDIQKQKAEYFAKKMEMFKDQNKDFSPSQPPPSR